MNRRVADSYKILDENERALLADLRAQALEHDINFEPKFFVQATALGRWPGEDAVDAVTRVRGELGDPHLSYLPELSQRGFQATTLARTIATFEGLEADGTSAGWRINSGFSQESQWARHTFASDINVLADVIGKESAKPRELKIQFVGPLSLSAQLYLMNGERVLSDVGARRDVRDSLIAGLEDQLKSLREAAPGAKLIVQFDELDMVSILEGTIATSSGYRTLRALRPHEVHENFDVLTQAVRQQNAQPVINVGQQVVPVSFLQPFEAVAQSVQGYKDSDWEKIAALVEAGQRLWLATVNPHAKQSVRTLVDSIFGPWRRVGLPAAQLSQISLTESASLEHCSPAHATAVLAHLTETATALSETAQNSE